MKHKLYFLKQFFKRLYHYPTIKTQVVNYDIYWKDKKKDRLGLANAFQLYRAKWISKKIDNGSSVLDLACGDGSVLLNIRQRKKIIPYGTDISKEALKILIKSGIESYELDIRKFDQLDQIPSTDHILALEILEHLPSPELLLEKIYEKSQKSVFISFPNSGYIHDRLRLFLGRFPLQWRTHPGEHLRFWTYKDLKWWLSELNYLNKSTIHIYEGVPFLNKLLPSIFGKAFIVEIKKD